MINVNIGEGFVVFSPTGEDQILCCFVVGMDILLNLFVFGKCNIRGNIWLDGLLLVGIESHGFFLDCGKGGIL
jgi:hypothetical protein